MLSLPVPPPPARRLDACAAALAALGLVVLATARPAQAQWTNRYPKVEGYAHHIYLEGYELPTLTSGPMDPAPGPKGERVAFAARGWIWILDRETGVARQLTTGAGIDARPAWSPDGSKIAFVRDDTRDTDVVVRTLATGEERVVTEDRNDPAIDLDPHFSPGGTHLYYASARAGHFDLWRAPPAPEGDEATRLTKATRLTEAGGLERRPVPRPGGEGVVYLKKGRPDAIKHLAFGEGKTPGKKTPLVTERIASQAALALAPDGRTLAYTWPHEDGYELRLLNVEAPGSSVRLARGQTRPLAPAFGPEGEHVWFATPTSDESTALRRVPRSGGSVQEVPVREWDWSETPGTLRIRTRRNGQPAPARLNVTGASGHPAVPSDRMIRFDGKNGRVFYYSGGTLELTLPPGEATVAAVQGLATPEATQTVRVPPGDTARVTLSLEPVRKPEGYASADHHFHLNYGGPYQLAPGDLTLDAKGEALDIATPLLANLHDRFLDQDLWDYEGASGVPTVEMGQEVRSHFLGHLSLLGTDELFWPWVWGPGYQVYDTDDRLNAQALRQARRQGGIGGYVHPVSVRDPFSEEGRGSVPVELVPDAVHGAVDFLEVACLWSDEIGTAALWHRLLSIGRPVAASAGSDVMTNFYRTMAVGATRAYVRIGGDTPDYETHLDGLEAGHGFVTNGPMLEFALGGAEPGQAVEAGEQPWSLDLRAATPVDSAKVFVNGEVAWRSGGLDAPGRRQYEGTLALPEGGWVTARAYGGDAQWPIMDSYPFAETNPVWIGQVGSTVPAAERRAARDLLRLLGVAEQRLRAGYGDAPTPKLQAHFEEARATLEAMTTARD